MSEKTSDWWEKEKQTLRKLGLSEDQTEELKKKVDRGEIDTDELSDPEFDLLFWATLIFGTLSAISFLLRLFSGSRSEKKGAVETEREEELIV